VISKSASIDHEAEQTLLGSYSNKCYQQAILKVA